MTDNDPTNLGRGGYSVANSRKIHKRANGDAAMLLLRYEDPKHEGAMRLVRIGELPPDNADALMVTEVQMHASGHTTVRALLSDVGHTVGDAAAFVEAGVSKVMGREPEWRDLLGGPTDAARSANDLIASVRLSALRRLDDALARRNSFNAADVTALTGLLAMLKG